MPFWKLSSSEPSGSPAGGGGFHLPSFAPSAPGFQEWSQAVLGKSPPTPTIDLGLCRWV